MSSLLIISSAPATVIGDQPFLDRKFADGMRFYSNSWDGSVNCILKRSSDVNPFGQVYDRDQLPFGVTILPQDKIIGRDDLFGHDIILCCGDTHDYLHLADICKNAGQKLVFTIENIVETRRQMNFLDRSKNMPGKLYSLIWMLNQERRRRRAFRLADGIQANGYPAMASYSAMSGNTLLYLDNRIGEQLLATATEMESRRQKQLSGARLRLLHSGRLEPMKGSQDLIPIARRLAEDGINFELNIFGSGSLETEIRNGIVEYNLQDRVFLNGVVDFETELVPFARENADIYLSCHRQSDPSCTYVESMGCGLAIAGYANQMWSELCRESEAGWAAPLGNVDALVDLLKHAAHDRKGLAKASRAARNFAATHSYEAEFQNRISHLERTVRI